MASYGKNRSGSPFRFYRPNSVDSNLFNFGSKNQVLERQKTKENVSVTIRFRPLSSREIQRGDDVAWYADGDAIVRSEYNPAAAYAFDRVFGPATTTRGVYDAAARHVVRGAMEGSNGTVFAYGVTSSGKTHTMHGDQRSPGIIPLAVKDVFSIIQDTPGRDFLLRVSYLEIYNEVINDLLDPEGQNLRIREDSQGTYVEAIKEEVVLSPAHALSLIAAGEELRHVGSNNFNLLSSRSHTIFTLTIESSSQNADYNDEEATVSQLNLIDLAGSESSKTETTGMRRKEGSYINKSLLTLGTVVAKLGEGKASHVPFRDSKLTRLLQSSLSGHGRVSLICTITPASSNAEETHNTLKFAQRAKKVEIRTAPNRVLNEKLLIKKYQKEIMNLKLELDHLRRGIVDRPYLGDSNQDLLTLRQQLEAGQVKMKSRLEEEEQAKAALMGRIQKLTKLILVSTKNSIPATLPSEIPTHRRRHSFGDEQVISSPEKRRESSNHDGDESGLFSEESKIVTEEKNDNNALELVAKDEKKARKRSVLSWFKPRKNENETGNQSPVLDIENHVSAGTTYNTVVQVDPAHYLKGGHRLSFGRKFDELLPIAESFPESTQAGELFSATARGRRPPPTGETMADQMDLLREQIKMLAGEVAFCTSSLKRMSEQAANNPDDDQIHVQMQKTRKEIEEKKQQIRILEQRIIKAGEANLNKAPQFEISQTISKIMTQLNEKAFELEIKTADNRIMEEQLQEKISENGELKEMIASLKQQLASAMEKKVGHCKRGSKHCSRHEKPKEISANGDNIMNWLSSNGATEELRCVEDVVEDIGSDSESCISEGAPKNPFNDPCLQSQILRQAAEIEKLKQEKVCLMEEKGGLQIQSQKLAEEASYAKELASAAAVELKNLAEEVTKLSFENAKLVNELATAQELVHTSATAAIFPASTECVKHIVVRENHIDIDIPVRIQGEHVSTNRQHDVDMKVFDIDSWELDPEDLKREIQARKEKETGLEAALAAKELVEAELHKRLDEAELRKAELENDLGGMWVLVANLRKEIEASKISTISEPYDPFGERHMRNVEDIEGLEAHGSEIKLLDSDKFKMLNMVRSELAEERQKVMELKMHISQLKSEALDGLEVSGLEDLQTLHMEALTKIYGVKAQMGGQIHKEKDRGLIAGYNPQEEEKNNHICKVCFGASTAVVLLPCRHFCLCKPCAVACTECPICRSGIADRIITFTS